MEQTIEINKLYSDDETAKFLFQDKYKPTSRFTVQKMGRAGVLRGKKVGRHWRFLGEAILDHFRRK